MSTTHSQIKIMKRQRRHARVRAKVSGTKERPRLSVYRSITGIRGQLIDDDTAQTLVFVMSHAMKGKTKIDRAKMAGTALAEAAKHKGITKVVFDRGGFLYAGQIRMFAESARSAGLLF